MNERGADRLSLRQLLVCAFAGGLSPAAAGAGHGWQGAALAIPVILLAGWGLCALAPRWRRLEERRAGRVLSLLYALWGVALLSRGLSRCAGRMVHAGGAETRHAVWIMLLVALPLAWMARGKPAAFFRACELFYPAAALTGAALLVWGMTRMEWRYAALPAPELLGGFLAALETAGSFLFILPCLGRTKPDPEKACGRTLGWLGALAGASVLFSLVAVGVLSPAVAAESGQPFFLMTAALGRAVRAEGLACAVWLLSDLALLGLLARSWQRAGTGKSWLPPLAVAVGTLGAALDLPELLPVEVWSAGTVVLAAVTRLFLMGVGENR